MGKAPGSHKRLFLVAVVAALLAAALVIAVARPAESQSTSSFEYTLGINPYDLTDVQLRQLLDNAKAAGVKSISSGAVWWYIDDGQSSPRSSYDWSGLDRLVNEAEARGMKVRAAFSSRGRRTGCIPVS